MFRMVICCGGGFSSSFIATKLTNRLKQRNLEGQVSVDFMSLHLVGEHLSEFDVVCCCPHLRTAMPGFLEKYRPEIPVYFLPQRMYGMMDFDQIYQDALDCVTLFGETGINPVVFPNEENFFKIMRTDSYRKTYGDYHQYLK